MNRSAADIINWAQLVLMESDKNTPQSVLIEMNSSCVKWNSVKLKMMQERFKPRARQVIIQVPLKCEWMVEGAYERVQENNLKFNFILDEIVYKKRWNINRQTTFNCKLKLCENYKLIYCS